MDDVRMHAGTLMVDLILPHAQSIKERRRALQSLVQRLQNRRLSVAQIGPTDLWQRAFIAVGAVAGTSTGLDEQLDAAERVIFASPFDVADVRRGVRQDSYSSLSQ